MKIANKQKIVDIRPRHPALKVGFEINYKYYYYEILEWHAKHGK